MSPWQPDDADGPPPFRFDADGALVRVRVTPKASASQVRGLIDAPDGGVALKVAVAAAPEGGKANAALVGHLAGAWGLPRSCLSIAAGAKDRQKVVRVAGDRNQVEARLRDWWTRSGGAE